MLKAAAKKRESLSQVAYSQIRSMILKRELLPGQFINEAELQQALGLGRTPVREALLALSQNGLVTVHPRKGVEITRPTLKAVHDIYEFRSLTELYILRRCFSAIDREWAAQLCALLEREQAHSDADPSQSEANFIHLDHRFHQELAATLNNQYINQQLRSMQDYLSLVRFSVWTPEEILDSNHTHIAILSAILDNDVEKACLRMSAHLKNSYQEAMETMLHMTF